MLTWLRRVSTVALWPVIDWIVTAFANFMLYNFGRFPLGVVVSVASTAALAASLNVGYLYLLYREAWIPDKLFKHTERALRLHARIPLLNRWKTMAIFIVYTLSGPAMLGAPLIWILDIKPKRGYVLAVIGVTINAIVWVGGVYNVLWRVIRDLLVQLPVSPPL